MLGAVEERRRALPDALRAGSLGAIAAGIPSTLHALVTGADLLTATEAAGSILLPRARRRGWLVLAAGPVHVALSLGWALVLARFLPRRRPVAEGAASGLAIAALDLGLIGRRLPRIRALPQLPQVADHVAYGVTVATVLARLSGRRSPMPGPPRRRAPIPQAHDQPR